MCRQRAGFFQGSTFREGFFVFVLEFCPSVSAFSRYSFAVCRHRLAPDTNFDSLQNLVLPLFFPLFAYINIFYNTRLSIVKDTVRDVLQCGASLQCGDAFSMPDRSGMREASSMQGVALVRGFSSMRRGSSMQGCLFNAAALFNARVVGAGFLINAGRLFNPGFLFNAGVLFNAGSLFDA